MKVAEGVLAGKTGDQIAAEAGVSRSTVQRDLRTPQVQQVIIGLVHHHQQRVDEIFASALDVIADSLTARKTIITSLGEVVDAGPDHFARLAAVKRHLEIVTAGRQAVKPSEEDRPTGVTWEDLQRLLAERRAVPD